MQKVYLLLRNNQQTGPFNLNELLQFDLKPFDLIWIEGKSAGWYYPQEIEALRPHLPFLEKPTSPVETTAQSTFSKTEPAAPKKIFVSMPAVSVVKETAQQISPKPLPAVEQEVPVFTSPVQSEPAELKTAYTKSLDEIETDYMNWAYRKKAKRKPLFSKSGIVVLCCLAGALFVVWKIANKPKAEIINTPSEQMAVATPASSLPENTPSEEKPAPQKTALHSLTAKKEKTAKNAIAGKNAEPVKQQTPAKHPSKEVAAAAIEKQNDYTPVAKEENKPVAEEKKEPVTADASKEKKSLKERIHDLFHKKPEDKKEEAKPAENDNGARQSTRREAGSSLVQMVTVKFDIPNSWMMGIKGAKATLTNRSSETLAKAVIEVRYYNDDNDLLDKKTITFSNIKSKQSGTVSVPEHATATRLEYSVLSAVGNEPVALLR
ncbi:hypothetical protein [Flavisolibacter ginsenosidimutans]|uniref:DUF4339 domain-containing protein n=1 Tax=Flavisolibacter ginsenosidimutans TaxID=661481 RepID=A0A5B8UKF9_9BACT|nr:hypothetical protein [Flavisolibacter ginsenosidimutans]QEC57038.1 hypothetical protein FSB75_14385 [Flavisolibacter ginsenosidimutans]